MGKDDWAWVALGALALLGAAAAAAALSRVPCPACGNQVKKGIPECPFCYTTLTWD